LVFWIVGFGLGFLDNLDLVLVFVWMFWILILVFLRMFGFGFCQDALDSNLGFS
jgi:hypothetical protein